MTNIENQILVFVNKRDYLTFYITSSVSNIMVLKVLLEITQGVVKFFLLAVECYFIPLYPMSSNENQTCFMNI